MYQEVLQVGALILSSELDQDMNVGTAACGGRGLAALQRRPGGLYCSMRPVDGGAED